MTGLRVVWLEPSRSDHVEGHAAAFMRTNGLEQADLEINRIPWLPGEMIAYLPDGRLGLTSHVLLFNGDDPSADEDVPSEAEHRSLRRSIGVPAVQDVLQNLELQTAGAETDVRLEALNYYLEHDAFISL